MCDYSKVKIYLQAYVLSQIKIYNRDSEKILNNSYLEASCSHQLFHMVWKQTRVPSLSNMTSPGLNSGSDDNLAPDSRTEGDTADACLLCSPASTLLPPTLAACKAACKVDPPWWGLEQPGAEMSQLVIIIWWSTNLATMFGSQLIVTCCCCCYEYVLNIWIRIENWTLTEERLQHMTI